MKNWSAGLEPADQELFAQLLGHNNKVLDRLCELCYNMINELEKESSDFDSPNWALRQANLIGQRSALQKVIKLCTPTQERDRVRK